MTDHPSALDRLEARLDVLTARIDTLYRLLDTSPAREKIAEPRRRPRRRRDRVAAIRHR
jgi:hypothetical protein